MKKKRNIFLQIPSLLSLHIIVIKSCFVTSDKYFPQNATEYFVTSLLNSFCMPNCSRIIKCSLDIPKVTTIILVEIWQLTKISLTCSTNRVETVKGTPECTVCRVTKSLHRQLVHSFFTFQFYRYLSPNVIL